MDGRWSSAEALKLLEPGALPAGCYVAEMDGAPFLVDGLAGKKHIKSASVVVGRLSVGEVAL
jgi:hypothetical protein